MLRAAGLVVLWLSGRESAATALRARELAVDELIQDPTARKFPAFEAALARGGLSWAERAFVGDDLAALPGLTRVGLPVAAPHAGPGGEAAAGGWSRAPGGQ